MADQYQRSDRQARTEEEVHSNGTVTFNVEVTADQPVGTYTGPIIDDKTGRDIGTVSIEITERKP